MSKYRVVLAAVLAAGMLSGVASAQGRSGGRGQEQSGDKKEKAADKADDAKVFKDGDLDVFRGFARRNNIVADTLPPGIEKNLQRGKPLPPGIARRELPKGFAALMPKVGRDTTFSIVGDKIVAMRGDTVVDMIDGVFKK